MPRRRALLALCVFGVGLAAGAGGCFGPTLPLPPPTALVSAPGADGFVDVTGEALPDGYVLALNVDTDEGVIGRADGAGRYALRVRADVGHTLEVWQMAGTEDGQHRTVTVPAP
jgi:hypothetical protein